MPGAGNLPPAPGPHRVARSKAGVQHIADTCDRDGTVLTRCGNTLPHPKHFRLVGVLCKSCDDVTVALAAGR